MHIKVCMGTHCVMMGASTFHEQLENVLQHIQDNEELKLREEVVIEAVKCQNFCKNSDTGSVSPVVIVDDEVFLNANAQEIMEKIYELAY